MGKFFIAQGRVTPKQILHSGPNSNFADILRLSWLPASLMKLRSKLKALLIRQGQIWASSEFELIQDFMAVLVTCKYDEDPIKSEVAILRTTFSLL